MNKLRNAFCMFFICMTSLVVHAADYEKYNGVSLREDFTHALPDTACVGKAHKANNPIDNQCPDNAVVTWFPDQDEFSTAMLVARKTNNEYGAYFCPTQILSANRKDVKFWLEFGELSSGDDCFWLCKEGYTGAECKTKISDYADSDCVVRSNGISQENYSNKILIPRNESSYRNIENEIAFLHKINSSALLYNIDSGRVVYMAVDHYLDNGRGAYVRPFATRSRKDGGTSYPTTRPFGDSELWCLPGYKQQGGDCVLATQRCQNEQMLSELCNGWLRENYKPGEHTLKKSGTADCYVYVCSKPGYAMDSDGNCSACNGSNEGVNKNGRCVHCADGSMWDNTSKTCTETYALTHDNLKYGIHGNQNDPKSQCWRYATPDAYRKCVLR